MSEVVDLTLSWCLGILVPGTPDHSGSGGAARVPQEEEALCLWLADQAPTTPGLWEGSLVLFSVPHAASSLSGWYAHVLGLDGLSESWAGCLEPREHHSSCLGISLGQPAWPTHCALSSGSFLEELEVDTLLLLQESVLCSQHVRGGWGGHVRCS